MKITKLLPYVLFFLSLVPLVGLLPHGLPLTHDGQDHVARIANFYKSLEEGVLIPRWAGNLNWGYGHPILMFLYPIPSYMASVFHFLQFSLVDSVKIVFGLSFVASALAMFFWIKTIHSKTAGFVAALLYAFAPYRFVDLYVRGAIGEHVAFVFPPLVMYFMHGLTLEKILSRKYYYTCGLSVSIAGLLLSHNAVAIMFMPIFLLYGIYLVCVESKFSWPCVIQMALSFTLGFGLASFFWVPAFFEGKYTLRDIVTGGETLKHFVPWERLFYSPWNFGGGDDLSKTIGIAQWIGVLASLVALKRSKIKTTKVMLLGTLAVLIASLFVMTAWSKPLWLAVTLLQKFQFPWRFLSVSVFAAATLGGIAAGEIFSKIHYSKYIKIGACIGIILLTSWMWYPKGYLQHEESFYTGIYFSTTDTGESSPVWSVRFMEHTPSAPMQIIDGAADIHVIHRGTIIHDYVVNAHSPSRLLENTLYFPGWNIYVDGKKTDIQFQDPQYRGLMTFYVDKGEHQIRIIFEDTKLRRIANMISIGSCIVLMVMAVLFLVKKKKI